MATKDSAAPILTMPDRQVDIMRIFDAPRELVFQAWTDREHLMRWYAPHGCTTLFRTFDFREGGLFHSCVRGPEGHECWCTGVYLEITAPERIVYTVAMSDAQGNPVEPAQAGMDPDWPKETVVTVTFARHGAGTKLTLRQTVSESLAKRTGAHPSWIEMLDRLATDLTHT